MPFSLRSSFGRVPVGKLLFELILVFVAVSAALFANAWWQGRETAARTRAALAAFAQEMRDNKQQIEERFEHHRTIVRSSEALLQELKSGQPPPADVRLLRNRLTDGKGMRAPVLSRAAWDSALATGVLGELPFATVKQLALVYEVQRRLDGLLDELIRSLASPSYFDVDRALPTVTAFMVTFSMIVELETNQVGAYDRCLQTLAHG